MTNALVRCADCGCLAQRLSSPGEEANRKVGPHTRETGERPSRDFEALPYCFVGAVAIHDECLKNRGQRMGEDAKAAAFKATIDEPRDCQKFRRNDPSKTPEEHVKMIEVEILRGEQQRQRDLDLANADARRERDSAEAERRRQDDRAYKEAQDSIGSRRTLRNGVICILVSVLLSQVVEQIKTRLFQKPPPDPEPVRSER